MPSKPLARGSSESSLLGALAALLVALVGVACSSTRPGASPAEPQGQGQGGASGGISGGTGGAAVDPSPGAAASGGADREKNGSSGGLGNAGSGVDEAGTGGGATSLDGGAAFEPLPGTNYNCEAPSAGELPALTLTRLTSELEEPVYLTAAPGDERRLFVVEKAGRVRVLVDGVLLEEPFLDITDRVDDQVEEMGLLGLAFHPHYQDNNEFFVAYSTAAQGGSNPAHTEVLAAFTSDRDNPDRASADSERRLLGVDKPEGNHNGGALQFGPDRLLYWALGDGGGGGDQHGEIGNGQALDTLLGKLLRVDVDGRGDGAAGEYALPADNYFASDARALPEIWALGLRNPWRFSFDGCSGDLYIGDVGQETLEEVDYLPARSGAGVNFGWRLMEAEACYEPASGCGAEAQGLTLPIASYDHEVGQSITGGYVYRGHALPELRGTYLYTDYFSTAFFALRAQNGASSREPLDISLEINPFLDRLGIASFGQDGSGELYLVSFQGDLYRIDPE